MKNEDLYKTKMEANRAEMEASDTDSDMAIQIQLAAMQRAGCLDQAIVKQEPCSSVTQPESHPYQMSPHKTSPTLTVHKTSPTLTVHETSPTPTLIDNKGKIVIIRPRYTTKSKNSETPKTKTKTHETPVIETKIVKIKQEIEENNFYDGPNESEMDSFMENMEEKKEKAKEISETLSLLMNAYDRKCEGCGAIYASLFNIEKCPTCFPSHVIENSTENGSGSVPKEFIIVDKTLQASGVIQRGTLLGSDIMSTLRVYAN